MTNLEKQIEATKTIEIFLRDKFIEEGEDFGFKDIEKLIIGLKEAGKTLNALDVLEKLKN